MTPRIAPLEPPYEADVTQALSKWMPPGTGMPPLALFRTIAIHPMLRDRLRPLGAGLLRNGLVPARARELVILRTCARCAAWYEWGVHVSAFAASVGLDRETIRATADATRADIAARIDDDGLVLRIADELHDTSTISDTLFTAAAEHFGPSALLELAALAGYYHLISYMIGVAGVELEPWAEKRPTKTSPNQSHG